jgi:hypothetical protein
MNEPNFKLSINVVRAYRRTSLGKIQYCVVSQCNTHLTIESNWLADDGAAPEITEHMKTFKLKPDMVRLFTAERMMLGLAPYLMPLELFTIGTRLKLENGVLKEYTLGNCYA